MRHLSQQARTANSTTQSHVSVIKPVYRNHDFVDEAASTRQLFSGAPARCAQRNHLEIPNIGVWSG